MDRDWHTRSHTLSQPQQRPRILRGRPAATPHLVVEVGDGGGGEAAEIRAAFQPSAGGMPSSPVGAGRWWDLGSGLRQSHWAPQPLQRQPSLLTSGDWHRQEVIKRPRHPAARALQ
ncbi:unnamed protein product [Rangifer tarandus platyrhynchus]|uniref:Uncharacterized protein n=2 Tax=Rangifer tarandus platyrhynchus TaxID=3082113 RepID=A0AC59Z0S9_RANTA|nr:unnamed protein product [Rangifer tarandus platyrhynchus]